MILRYSKDFCYLQSNNSNSSFLLKCTSQFNSPNLQFNNNNNSSSNSNSSNSNSSNSSNSNLWWGANFSSSQFNILSQGRDNNP